MAVLVVLGAVIIIGAMVSFVLKSRRTIGRKGQGLSFLSVPFRRVVSSLMGNKSTPHIATVSTWVLCQFWELPSVKIFLELSQLFFSQVEKEGATLQLEVSEGDKIVSQNLGVKPEVSQHIIAPPAPPVSLLGVLFLLLHTKTGPRALT